jgi:hypothetical protein
VAHICASSGYPVNKLLVKDIVNVLLEHLPTLHQVRGGYVVPIISVVLVQINVVIVIIVVVIKRRDCSAYGLVTNHQKSQKQMKFHITSM